MPTHTDTAKKPAAAAAPAAAPPQDAITDPLADPAAYAMGSTNPTSDYDVSVAGDTSSSMADSLNAAFEQQLGSKKEKAK